MKKLLLAACLCALLLGCAAAKYQTARDNANLIKNGMTVAQASEILGMAPTHLPPGYAEWRRGNAQRYTGTRDGAIQFKVVDGVIVGVPDGGIFGPAAFDQYMAEINAENAARDLSNAEAARIRDEKSKAEIARVKEAISYEAISAIESPVTCNDKITCNKVFALAQIYAMQNSTQKIQVATDTIIQTYNPTDGGNIGITIIKKPQRGTIEIVTITPTCKNEEYDKLGIGCIIKRTEIYRGFRPYIEANLSR